MAAALLEEMWVNSAVLFELNKRIMPLPTGSREGGGRGRVFDSCCFFALGSSSLTTWFPFPVEERTGHQQLGFLEDKRGAKEQPSIAPLYRKHAFASTLALRRATKECLCIAQITIRTGITGRLSSITYNYGCQIFCLFLIVYKCVELELFVLKFPMLSIYFTIFAIPKMGQMSHKVPLLK